MAAFANYDMKERPLEFDHRVPALISNNCGQTPATDPTEIVIILILLVSNVNIVIILDFDIIMPPRRGGIKHSLWLVRHSVCLSVRPSHLPFIRDNCLSIGRRTFIFVR